MNNRYKVFKLGIIEWVESYLNLQLEVYWIDTNMLEK